MKSIMLTLVSILFLSVAHATEVFTTIPAEWIETDGSRTFYGASDGPCGSNIFGVSKSLPNFTEMKDDLVVAMIKSYRVDLVVESCSGTKNIVTFAKVCRDPAYC